CKSWDCVSPAVVETGRKRDAFTPGGISPGYRRAVFLARSGFPITLGIPVWCGSTMDQVINPLEQVLLLLRQTCPPPSAAASGSTRTRTPAPSVLRAGGHPLQVFARTPRDRYN